MENNGSLQRAYSIGGMTTPTMYRLPSMQVSPSYF